MKTIRVPPLCSDYTSYLKTVTPDILKPFLVEVSTTYMDHSLVLYITVNTMHMPNYNSQKTTHYSLTFESKKYKNLYTVLHNMVGFNQLKFVIPTSHPYKQYDIISFTLVDHLHNRTYANVKSCVHLPPATKLPLITCSYISDYNTIAELRAFIAFHRVQNVSMIVFYQSTPINGFKEAFGKLIESGYLSVVDFTWPRPNTQKLPQFTNQQAQMNSCFNRFRYVAEAILFCDVDEYIYSPKFPYHLPLASQYLINNYKHNDAFTVRIWRSLNY